MANARAIASGNWSSTSTWNGGVLPGNGDTVYANGFNVTIDQNVDIGGANNPTVNAGSFVSGQWYEITSVGSTTFTSIGAAANTVGTIFQASGVGSGTGQARARATLTTATNAAAGATTGGGGFTLPTAPLTVNADQRAGTTTCLNITATSGVVTLNNIIAVGGTTGTSYAILNSSSAAVTFNQFCIFTAVFSSAFHNASSGAINLTGDCTFNGGTGAGGSNVTSSAFNNNSTGNVNLSGSCIFNGGTGAGSAFNNGAAFNNNSTGNVTLSGSCIFNGGNAGGGSYAHGFNNQLSGSVTISGNCTFSTNSTGFALNNQASGTISISGNCNYNAGSFAACLNNTAAGSLSISNGLFSAANGFAAINSTNASATNRFSGTFISSPNGTQPINAPRWFMNTTPTTSYIQHALDGINLNSFVRFFTADNSTALNQAAPTDVRSGVAYGIGNSQTGRLTVPARGSVALSVNYGPSMPFTATRSGTTATATLAYSYPLVVGDQITVTGASNTEWNGSYTIASVVSGTSVTFTVPATHSATAGSGALMQTTGTAILTADAIWNSQTSTMTTAGSIGERLANASTVATTGQQITAALG